MTYSFSYLCEIEDRFVQVWCMRQGAGTTLRKEMGMEKGRGFRIRDTYTSMGAIFSNPFFFSKSALLKVAKKEASHLPPQPHPLGCPRELALSALLHASNSHWSRFTHGKRRLSALGRRSLPLAPPARAGPGVWAPEITPCTRISAFWAGVLRLDAMRP